ncbi:MAG: aldehyde ferredoxin oxidoreductase [Chloroflexi bacterium]|nr:aldehyde ferredoxin oxidoreductase [Chloroflexota bacterium]
MWILRINTSNLSYELEEVPEKYKLLYGRALTSQMVYDEVPPLCHPLGPNNKLIFSAGMVTGTVSPTSARISVGGKSPLTGGIKEANAGTAWGPDLAKLRIRALVLEGQPLDTKTYAGALIKWDGEKPVVEFFDATEYTGKDVYDIYPSLFERWGPKVSIASMGVVSEMGYSNSGIVFNDMHNRPSRYAGRGGLGAVLASKRMKFVILDAIGAPGVEMVDRALFDEGRKKLIDAIRSHPISKPKGGLNSYGTAVLVNILNEAGGLPTRNFSAGRFEGAAKTSGEAIFETNKERMGKEIYNHPCSPGCIIQCSNTYYNPDGTEATSCIEYESTWSLGANLGIDNLDDIAIMNQLCNGYGLDTIETGGSLGVAMEAGLLQFGDSKGAIQLIHEMGKGTPLGRTLSGGVGTTGKIYGVRRVPAVKGQGMPAYEPRAVKGIGITYATSPMGADHTAGYTICPEILGVSGKLDPLSPEGKAALSRAFQATTAFIDSSGHCLFIAFPILDIASGFEGMIQECNGILGTNWDADAIVAYGSQTLKVERAFNEAAGLSKEADRIPEFMKTEPLYPHNQVFDIPDAALDSVFEDL